MGIILLLTPTILLTAMFKSVLDFIIVLVSLVIIFSPFDNFTIVGLFCGGCG